MLFEGARLIAGDGSTPVESSAFLVQDDTITRVGRKGEIQVADGIARIDLTGKTVMPALIDTHSHLGYTRVQDNSTAAVNFTRENLVDHLDRYAYYGVAATLSMGVDRGELPFELREHPRPRLPLFRTAGRGIALPNAGPGQDFRRDAPYGVTTEEEARKAVQELAARKVDIVKIWVDDREGTVKKLPPPSTAQSSTRRTLTISSSRPTSSIWPMRRTSCGRGSTASLMESATWTSMAS